MPPLTGHVIDQTGTLDAIQAKGLDDKLTALEQAKGTQVVVLMVPTTKPEDDASFANRVANEWKIGRKKVGDGVLVVVAKDDHKVRIEVAKTLEGAVPDLAAKQVIDDAMLPKFRQNDFAGGLQAGVDQLVARINGEALPEPARRKAPQSPHAGGGGIDWFDLAIFLFIGVPIAGLFLRGIFGRAFGSLLTGAGAGVIAMLVTSSMLLAVIAAFVALGYTLLSGALGMMSPRRGAWGGGGPFIGGGGGGWSSGGGGGGWSSGGGGDFGGGGASGSW
ncbi:MAG TPA: TPM domain-containing protein [Ramlibacter sp.]|nr:TPM domain-containing protein [Ramlibacter sp.]